jgi:hypothetical protein
MHHMSKKALRRALVCLHRDILARQGPAPVLLVALMVLD